MKLKRFAQSTILLTTNTGESLLVDPGKYNLDPGKSTLTTFPAADVIVITHKHADHFDLELLKAVLRRKMAQIFTNSEIKEILKREGIDSEILIENHQTIAKGFSLLAIRTDHVVKDEQIVNFGIVILAEDTSIYHTSDTRFIEPSLLPAETRAKYLLIPISNRGVVMGIDDALVFTSELKPELVIPIHYDSPKDINRVNPQEFVMKIEKNGIKSKILSFGEEITL